MRQLLIEVSPNFDENLKRAFRNEAVRLQRKQNHNHHIHPLDDVLLSIDDTKIELRNLKFPWIPDFRIVDMSTDLPMSCLDLSLNLGNLRIEGEYEANNTTLRRWLPVSHVGRIVIGFNNVRANGKVGLILKQDSFVPQNYDIKYEPTDVIVRVSYHVDADNEVENEITNSDIGNIIFSQLKKFKYVSSLIWYRFKQLCTVPVE
ncbi:JHBP domain containing protein [Asbolus verrucosus]|uniref:JHBP domain containing protein n=1 Tax=Asbolus verrucosus TaxID=1661398 RepID=A0A482VLS2_ASBVE|nr:JHBP domain containing protein [Asbolus verrucosus]